MPFCAAGRTELASELAFHFEEGREYEKAARCLMMAAENAAGRFAYRDSIQILNRALELVPSDRPASGFELQLQILQRIGDAQYVRGEMSDSVASYEAAAERAAQAGLPAVELAVLMRLALPAWHFDPARGNQVSERAIEVSWGLSDPVLLARAQLAAASFRLLYDAWREEDAKLFAQAQETIERSGASVPQEVFSIYVIGIQGDYQGAQRLADALIDSTTNPTAHVQAMGAKGFMNLCLGRFGEVLRIVRTEQELAERNNTDPWIWNCGESWLCALCYDFDGVRRLGAPDRGRDEALQGAWTRAVAKIYDGYARVMRGDFEEASRCFDQVRDLQITPKFFLHWHWRMHAELGATEARLAAGDLENASREADGFLASALSVPDPNMRALAWEVQARVARARQRPDHARESLDKAFAIMDDFDLPLIAWQVHRTAWDLNSDLGNREQAERHRAEAKEQVLRIADSFEYDEPLRKFLLTAPPVRRIFEEAASA
jgi:tetratricopeptide (TPR) repeat protein